jgi:hypothetical protein
MFDIPETLFILEGFFCIIHRDLGNGNRIIIRYHNENGFISKAELFGY